MVVLIWKWFYNTFFEKGRTYQMSQKLFSFYRGDICLCTTMALGASLNQSNIYKDPKKLVETRSCYVVCKAWAWWEGIAQLGVRGASPRRRLSFAAFTEVTSVLTPQKQKQSRYRGWCVLRRASTSDMVRNTGAYFVEQAPVIWLETNINH